MATVAGEDDAEREEGAAGECEEDAAGEGPVRLALGEGDVPGLALVIPALHAARDRPAAQVITAMAVRRCVFIRCPFTRFVSRCQFKTRRAPCRGDRGTVAVLRHRAQFRHGRAPEGGC